MDLDQLKQRVLAELDPKRARHTEAVADLARKLAQELGEDPARAHLAGFLHDCAKRMSIDEQLAFAKANGVPLSAEDRASLGTIHGKLGALIAEREFGVRDEAVLEAVRWHSTGRAGMTRLDKIVMAADFLEPNRRWAYRESLLAELRADFDVGMFEIARRRLVAILEKGRPMHPDGIALYNELLESVRRSRAVDSSSLPKEKQ